MAGGTDPGRPRVFGIGLNKTATSSLHESLTMLGFNSLHWGGPPIRRLVEASLAAGEQLLSRLDPSIDAFSDIEALSTNYELLDAQYPGSVFVLTVRPLDDWIDSRRRHVERNVERKRRGEYDGEFLVVDEPAWRSQWQTHVDGVRRYFGDRQDFLEIDLTSTPAWEPICSMLDVPVPAEPFPWVNKGDR